MFDETLQWSYLRLMISFRGLLNQKFNFLTVIEWLGGLQVAAAVKNAPASAGDMKEAGSIPGSGRAPGEDNDNRLQHSCLENPVDRGARWATICHTELNTTEATQHMHT